MDMIGKLQERCLASIKKVGRTLAGTVLLASFSAPLAEAGPHEPARFEVGSTGLYCYTEPCPRRGIRRVTGNPPEGPHDLLWSDEGLPATDASSQDHARLSAAWNAYECLVVEGAFDGRSLAVTSILGPCRDREMKNN